MKKSSKVHLFSPYRGPIPLWSKTAAWSVMLLELSCASVPTSQRVPGNLPNSTNRRSQASQRLKGQMSPHTARSPEPLAGDARWGPRGAPHTH